MRGLSVLGRLSVSEIEELLLGSLWLNRGRNLLMHDRWNEP